MSSSVCSNDRGISLVEVMIAVFLTVVAVLAVFALQPSGWRTAARADFLGRAAGILHEELQRAELFIMNPCNSVTTGTTAPTTVYASGMTTAQPGDIPFSVTTTTTSIGTNVWRVTVQVTWPGNNQGIRESIVVTRQEGYRFPAGCAG